VIQGCERLDADLIVAGIGVRPATALAELAELHVDNGIVVDTYLETAHPGVFAIGDAARWPDLRAGGSSASSTGCWRNVRARRSRARSWVSAHLSGACPSFGASTTAFRSTTCGHVERWEAIEVDGKLEQHDGMVHSRDAGQIVAVASLSRDRESLEAELTMEHDVTAL
jgi:hypothetical protein